MKPKEFKFQARKEIITVIPTVLNEVLIFNKVSILFYMSLQYIV
jgi:hypothetical protein